MKSLFLYIVVYFSVLPIWAQAEQSESPNFLVQAFPFVVMFGIFYFLMIRPQANKQRALQEFNQKLKKGDRVLTSSGIFGTIEGLTEKYVTLEIADDVNIRVLRGHVTQPVKEGK